MATGGQREFAWDLVIAGVLPLEEANEFHFYTSLVVCQDKIIVLDFKTCKINIHRLQDAKFLASSNRLETIPRDMCLMDAMKICVLHEDGLIQMMSIDTTDMSRVFKTTRTLRLQGELDRYHGVVRFKDNLVVSGKKQGTMYWCVVSLYDGHINTIHQICKGEGWSYVATKDNFIYISCYAGVESLDNNGVYGFDILNPSQCKYTYKHQRLQYPRSIVINEDGNIFVCDYGFTSIHQLTASCQCVAIFTQGIPRDLRAIVWDNGHLYATCYWSHEITVFRLVYQGDPVLKDTPSTSVQDVSIQQLVEKTLDQAEILMSTEDQDLFLNFQREIGTTLYFSADQQSLNDAQKSLDHTESFLKKHKSNVVGKWLEYRDQGKLTPELIDVIYAEERNQKLHENKDYFLNKMEQLNIISRARSFNENGVKEENYFFTPCVLRKKSPREVIAPENDTRMVSTSVLCWVITGNVLLPVIFQKLNAACLARWPVAKKKETSENLIFQDCTVFDLDPIRRLFLHCDIHAVYARITMMEIDNVNAKICTRVRKFISKNLTEIISHQDPNLKYKLCVQNAESQDIPEDIRSSMSPPCEMWFFDEVYDPDAPITREHMNHARLCVALLTVCGKAMRTILQANVSSPHTNIYQAILANKSKLISRTQNGSGKWQNALLNKDQCKMLFPDSKRQYTASVDQFDIALLYTLIRNVSSVKSPSTDWGVAPQDRPRDKSLGANVERIHLYRNEICGHSVDGQISQDDFEDNWNKIDSVLRDIDAVIGGQAFSQELEKQKRQVISVYEAC